MCMRNSEEGCILQEQQEQLKCKVENIDERLTKVEVDVGKMRSETQEGFKQGAAAMQAISTSVANLAHDFGQRFNSIARRSGCRHGHNDIEDVHEMIFGGMVPTRQRKEKQ